MPQVDGRADGGGGDARARRRAAALRRERARAGDRGGAAGARRPDHGAPAPTAQNPAAWAAQATAGATFDAYDRLGAATAPTLVQHGDEDVVVDPRNADLLVELLPDARLERFPGAGHLFFWEAPERFVSSVAAFLGGRDGSELTIGRWLADRARLTPDRVAIRFLGGELTYAALDRRADRLAAGLAERGLRRGDRLATLTRTSPDHVATLFACARLGVALSRSRGGSRRPRSRISSTTPSRAPPRLGRARGAAHAASAARSVEFARIGDPTLEADGEVEDVARDDDPLLLVYTSGTTGKPKGALLTHANCFWTNLSFDRDDRPARRRRRPPGAAAVPRRRLERAAAARVVEGRDGRARAGVRRRRARSR